MDDEYIDKVEVGAKIQMMYIRREMDYGGENDFCRGMRKALRVIENMPAADVQPVDRWISVDERLPKTGESVLVYVAINENLKGFGECKPEIRIGWLDDGDKWALQFSNMNYSEVLCWMPLPEPPKDGDTDA